jgi:hypothetical protein
MSIADEFELKSGPKLWHYKRRAEIRPELLCEHCNGLGRIRVMHSFIGDKNWKTCRDCHGTGNNGKLEEVERKLDRV